MYFIYINSKTLEYPFLQGDIRALHPEIPESLSGDTFPCPPDFARVNVMPAPAYDEATHTKQLATSPNFVDGVWYLAEEVRELTQEELDAREAARKRFEEQSALMVENSSPTGPIDPVIFEIP